MRLWWLPVQLYYLILLACLLVLQQKSIKHTDGLKPVHCFSRCSAFLERSVSLGRRGKLECSACVCVPCPVCGDFLPPGTLLQPPPVDHQHESSWHHVVHRDGSRHHFPLVSTGMLAFCRAFLVCMWVDGLCFSSVHCLYTIPQDFVTAFYNSHCTGPVSSTVQPR